MASSTSQPTVIFLWMVPRTQSTVLAKCMTFVDDTEVWLEPYLSCDFNNTLYDPNWKKGDPLAERMRESERKNEATEVMKSARKKVAEEESDFPNLIPQKDISYPWVQKQLEKATPDKKFIFVKDESHVIMDHLEYLPNVPTRHTFIIRHPREVYPSWKNMTMRRLDVAGTKSWEEWHVADNTPIFPVKDFFQIHHRLWKHFQINADFDPIIIDGHDLTSKPEVILPKYFKKLGIPYKGSYLEWKEDNDILEKKWRGSADFVLMDTKVAVYTQAANSCKFLPPKFPRGTPSNPGWNITPDLEEVIEGALPYYNEMYENRLQ